MTGTLFCKSTHTLDGFYYVKPIVYIMKSLSCDCLFTSPADGTLVGSSSSSENYPEIHTVVCVRGSLSPT